MTQIQLFQRQGENHLKASYSPNGKYMSSPKNIYEKIVEVEEDIFRILFLSGDIVKQEEIINNLANNY